MIVESNWRASASRRAAARVGIAVLLAAPCHLASAQEALGAVSGVVTMIGSERPVSGVTVALNESRLAAASDSLGRYRILGVPPGEYVMTIRRIGFSSGAARITVGAGTELTADIDINPSAPAQLEEVHVVVDARPRGKLAAFEHRRSAQAGGIFIPGAVLDSAVARGESLSQVLAKALRGAQIMSSGRTGGVVVSSGRGRMTGRELPLADPADPKSPRGCWAQVYLDGMRIYTTKNAGMMVPDIRDIPLESLAAVEYYAGEAQTPPEFAGEGAVCGTIAFWTK